MKADFYGLILETPRVTFYLWSPWRASALEHRLFEQIRNLPGTSVEQDFDELRIHLADSKLFRTALHNVSRVLKGWQEEADPGRERRLWRWLMEADTDDNGFDHAGDPVSLWGFLRLVLDRGNLDDGEKGEDVDLNGFGLRVWPNT